MPEIRSKNMSARLLRQAEQDLVVARRNLVPGSYYVAAFLAHQAAEKGLKAAHWYVRREEPPWKHGLSACAERVAEAVGVIPFNVDNAIDRLNPIFERTRYPGPDVDDLIPADIIGNDDARTSIGFAEEVLAWVRTLIQL